MKNQGKQQNEGFFNALIGERTAEKTAGLIYTIAALAIFFVSFVLIIVIAAVPMGKDGALYLNYLAAPIAFLLVAVWYFSYTKTPIAELAKEQKCHGKYYLIAILLQIGLFGLSEVNGIFIRFLQRFGYTPAEIELPSMDGFGFVGVVLTIAVLPSIMEEFVFRGIFLRETKSFSLWKRAIICGALFALYHQNPAQTMYQFVCGVSFSLVAIKSGSMLPTMLSHFINNALILTLTKLGITAFPPTVYAIILVVAGVCLVSSLLYLLAFDRAKEEEKKRGKSLSLFACAGLGIAVLALSWLSTLLAGG